MSLTRKMALDRVRRGFSNLTAISNVEGLQSALDAHTDDIAAVESDLASHTHNINALTNTKTSWTPTAAFDTPGTSSWAYGTRTCYYVKIAADLFYVSIDFTATPTIGTGSGIFRISAPAAISISTGGNQALSIHFTNSSFTLPGHTLVGVASSSGFFMRTLTSAGASTNLGASNMSTGASHQVIMSGIIYTGT